MTSGRRRLEDIVMRTSGHPFVLSATLSLALCGVGCGNSGTSEGTPAGQDATVTDAPIDASVAGDVSIPETAFETTGTNDSGASDVMAPDIAGADIASADLAALDVTALDVAPEAVDTEDAAEVSIPTSFPGEVVYLFGPSATSLTLMRVSANGGTPTPVEGVPAGITLKSLDVAEHVSKPLPGAVKPHAVLRGGMTAATRHTWVRLPGGLGLVGQYLGAGSYGLLQVRPDGTVVVLANSATASKATGPAAGFGSHVSVSMDGKLGAFVREDGELVLVRFDGTTWPGSIPPSAYIVVSDGIAEPIVPQSVTVGSSRVLFASSKDMLVKTYPSLWSAPLDASAPPSQITLPTMTKPSSAGKFKVYEVFGPPATDVARKLFVYTATGDSSTRGVLVVAEDANEALNITPNASTSFDIGQVGPSYDPIMDGAKPNLAMNPGGTLVAFGKTKPQIRTVDGSETTDLVPLFVSGVDTYGGFYWASDDDLLFWAGAGGNAMGLYHYRVSTKTLKNRAGSTKTEAPFDGGSLTPSGGWLAKDGTRLYFLISSNTYNTTISVIDFTLFAATAVTKEMDVSATEYGTAPGSKWIYFPSATWVQTSKQQREVYAFDESTADPASVVKLSNTAVNSQPNDVFFIEVAPDGGSALFNAAPAANAAGYATVSHTAIDGGGASKVVLDAPGYAGRPMWLGDSQAFVVARGQDDVKRQLVRVAIAGGGPVTLDAATGFVAIVHVTP